MGHLRKMGVRLILYLDNILIMAESKALAEKDSLLTSLGLVLNNEKSVLELTQEIEFLHFRVDFKLMSLSLPGEKIRSIKKECQHLLNNPTVEVRFLSQLLGKLSAPIQGVFPAPLHYHFLIWAKKLALKQNNKYETGRNDLTAWNGKSLLRMPDNLIMETDTSNLGWGFCAME